MLTYRQYYLVFGNTMNYISQIFIVLICILNAFADGFIIIDPPIIPPYPVPRPPTRPPYENRPTYTILQVITHLVKVRIEENIATTEVDQTFRNPTPYRLEGRYMFPIPADVVIDKFELEIDGKMIEAELLPSSKAKSIYEELVRRTQDPALLEFSDKTTLSARITPFEPYGTRRVFLRYTQYLKGNEGVYEYVYPLRPELLSITPIQEVSIEINLSTLAKIRTVYSPTHNVLIQESESKPITVIYRDRNILPDKDFRLFYSVERPKGAHIFLPYLEKDEEGYFLLIWTPTYLEESIPKLPRNIIFVLDSSGSMAGKKMQQAIKALSYGLTTLQTQDKFDVIRFSTEVEPLFGKLVEANQENIEKAQDFLERTDARGGTALHEAIMRAINQLGEEKLCYIILITDGQPTVGIVNPDKIIDSVTKRLSNRHRLYLFGVGYDVNAKLLDQLAGLGNGVAEYIVPEEDIEIKISSFFNKIQEPILQELNLEWIGNVKVYSVHPRQLPDIFKGEEILLVGCYKGSGDTELIINGYRGGERQQQIIKLSFPKKALEYDFVPKLWAMREVGYLINQIRIKGETHELVQQIIDLSKKYGIVTPYTAYLILEDRDAAGIKHQARSFPELFDSGDIKNYPLNHKVLVQKESGPTAIGAARALRVLNNAFSPDYAIKESFWEAMRGVEVDRNRFQIFYERELETRIRYIRGRAFVLRNNVWVQFDIDDQEIAQAMELRFASNEYFELIAKHPQLAYFFAIGPELIVRIDSKVIKVVKD